MRGTFGQLRAQRQGAPTVPFERLTTQYRGAFLRLFAPKAAAEIAEARAARVPQRTLNTLYGGLDYVDFEAGIYEFITALPEQALVTLVKNWQFSFLSNAFTKENRAAGLALFTARVSEFAKVGSRTQQWLAANTEPGVTPSLLQLEPMLCSLYWAFENPAAFDLNRQQFLLIGVNTLWETLPEQQKGAFRAAGWLIPTLSGTRALLAGDMPRVLTASPSVWTNLEDAP